MLAATALAAQAQSTQAPDTRWKFGVQLGTVHDNSKDEPVVQLSFGYDIDRTWSVEALGSFNALFVRDGSFNAGRFEFDHAFGARVLATMPLSERWNLVGGLGVAQVHEERGLDIYGDSRDRTGALVSLAAMYRMNRHFGLGVEASSFTQSGTLNLGVRGELHF